MSPSLGIKQIVTDYFHSGHIYRMDLEEVIAIRERLDHLLHQADGFHIQMGMTELAIEDLLGKPVLELDNSWFYPSAFEGHHYRIRFDKNKVKSTDFVSLKIS